MWVHYVWDRITRARTKLWLKRPHASMEACLSPQKRPKVDIAAVPSSPAALPKVQRTSLNAEQVRAADTARGGANCFFTGPAGVGKSYLLRYTVQELQARHPGEREIAVTAPTGIAASHVNGVTIHSFGGIGLGKGSSETLLRKVEGNPAAVTRWSKVKALVVDEVSMLDSKLFDALDLIARTVRGRLMEPFGGIQLVLSGDFYQLPPISLGQYGAGFVFEATAWRTCCVRTLLLSCIVRQQGDQAFIMHLNRVRLGQCPPATTAALAACHINRKPLPSDGILPTKLYCKNKAVDEVNMAKLRALEGNEEIFYAKDRFKSGSPDAAIKKQLLNAMEKKSVQELHLKIGAQVMLTRNRPDLKLVNGSRGVVVGFTVAHCQKSDSNVRCPVVRFDSGTQLTVTMFETFQAIQGLAMTRLQCPLKLAWALTVHKSQGMTLSRAELQLDDAFEFAQVYVALSRVISMEGLWIRGGEITQAVVKAHPAAHRFYAEAARG